MWSDDQISVQTCDGETFLVPRKLRQCSRTLHELSQEVDLDKDVVVLPQITAKVLKRLVAWWNLHKDDPEPPAKPEVKHEGASAMPPLPDITAEPKVISTVDQEFFKPLSHEDIFELILATNFLHIEELLDLCCATVANMTLGKTPTEIYKMFDVKEELTPEEEDEIRKENPWLDDK